MLYMWRRQPRRSVVADLECQTTRTMICCTLLRQGGFTISPSSIRGDSHKLRHHHGFHSGGRFHSEDNLSVWYILKVKETACPWIAYGSNQSQVPSLSTDCECTWSWTGSILLIEPDPLYAALAPKAPSAIYYTSCFLNDMLMCILLSKSINFSRASLMAEFACWTLDPPNALSQCIKTTRIKGVQHFIRKTGCICIANEDARGMVTDCGSPKSCSKHLSIVPSSAMSLANSFVSLRIHYTLLIAHSAVWWGPHIVAVLLLSEHSSSR